MADLIFYGTPGGKLVGPYHPDEMFARANAIKLLNGRSGLPVYMIKADTYEQARRKLPRK
jgi:hypothetical protein